MVSYQRASLNWYILQLCFIHLPQLGVSVCTCYQTNLANHRSFAWYAVPYNWITESSPLIISFKRILCGHNIVPIKQPSDTVCLVTKFHSRKSDISLSGTVELQGFDHPWTCTFSVDFHKTRPAPEMSLYWYLILTDGNNFLWPWIDSH